MKRYILMFLLSGVMLFANSGTKTWTIVIYENKDIVDVEKHISMINKNKKAIYVLKTNNKHIITYGAFSSQKEAFAVYKNIKSNSNYKNCYILKTKYNLVKKDNISDIVSVIEKTEEKKLTTPNNVEDINTTAPKNIVIMDINLPFDLGIGLEYSQLNLSGDFQLENSDKTDISKDLNIKSTKDTYTPIISITYNKHNFYTKQFKNYYSHSTSLDNNLTLLGNTFQNDTLLKSKLETSWQTIGYAYQNNNIKIGFESTLYSVKTKFENSNDTNNITVTSDRSFIIPSMKFDHIFNIGDVSLNYGFNKGYGLDIEYLEYYYAYVRKCDYLKDTYINIGYKNKDVKINNNDKYNLDYAGYYINFTKYF